jgi:hypothetical protein
MHYIVKKRDALVTVAFTHDDGWRLNPKHVQHSPNK